MLAIRTFVLLVFSFCLLTGCISPKSFVDPSVEKISYDALKKPAKPLQLSLAVEFQRNGQHYDRVDPTLKASSERILRATGVIVTDESNTDGNIKIVVNNIADTADAAAKGFGTGLTFGAAGTIVMDAYEMSITIQTKKKTITRTAIRHAIYTAIGNTTLPPNAEIIPVNVAFDRVLEQMIIRALHQMQKSKELASVDAHYFAYWHQLAQNGNDEYRIYE